MIKGKESEDRTELVPPRRGRLKVIFFGFVILICGMLIGSGVTVFVLWKTVFSAARNPEEITAKIAGRLNRSLDLDEAQARQVLAILNRNQKEILAIRRDAQPRLIRLLDQTYEEIDALLTPEQKPEWKQIFEKAKQRWIPPLPEPKAESQTESNRSP